MSEVVIHMDFWTRGLEARLEDWSQKIGGKEQSEWTYGRGHGVSIFVSRFNDNRTGSHFIYKLTRC